jgi:hypothetical protein
MKSGTVTKKPAMNVRRNQLTTSTRRLPSHPTSLSPPRRARRGGSGETRTGVPQTRQSRSRAMWAWIATAQRPDHHQIGTQRYQPDQALRIPRHALRSRRERAPSSRGYRDGSTPRRSTTYQRESTVGRATTPCARQLPPWRSRPRGPSPACHSR